MLGQGAISGLRLGDWRVRRFHPRGLPYGCAPQFCAHLFCPERCCCVHSASQACSWRFKHTLFSEEQRTYILFFFFSVSFLSFLVPPFFKVLLWFLPQYSEKEDKYEEEIKLLSDKLKEVSVTVPG